jgi:glutamyl-tRNA reductase
MIESRVINNKEHNLQEREKLIADLAVNKNIPHVLLATCNRTELYWGDGEVPLEMAEHLFRVASGLESAIVGERAIQGQIKLAYQEAMAQYNLSAGLNKVFQYAMHTGKRVRTETRISEGAVSHSQVAVDVLAQHNIDFQTSRIKVVGINKLNEDILKFLSAKEAKNVVVVNRHQEKALPVAGNYGYKAVALTSLRTLLEETDVLISATSAPHTIFSKEDFPAGREILVVDLAFPRDVDESVGELLGIFLYNIEDIERIANQNIKLRHEEIGKADVIIHEELDKFMKWQDLSLNKTTQTK